MNKVGQHDLSAGAELPRVQVARKSTIELEREKTEADYRVFSRNPTTNVAGQDDWYD